MIPLAPVLVSNCNNGTEKDIIYSLGQENLNEVKLGHVMPLALVSVSHDADGIINGTTALLMSRPINEVQYDFFDYVMPLALTLWSCNANSIINEAIPFLRSRQSI